MNYMSFVSYFYQTIGKHTDDYQMISPIVQRFLQLPKMHDGTRPIMYCGPKMDLN